MKLFNPLMIAGLIGGNVGLLIAICAVAVIAIGVILFAKCTVTYIDPENDEEITQEKFPWLSKVSIPDAKKENKRFLGWSLNARGTAPIGKERLRLKKSVVLYAVWDENYGTLCEFDANAVLELVYVNANDEEIKKESHPVKVVLPETDADIIGWAFDKNGKPAFDSNPETNTVLSVKLYPVYADAAEEPVEEVVEEVAEEVIEEAPAEEIIEEAIEEPVEEVAEEVAEEPIEEVAEEVAEEVIEEAPVEEPVEEPVVEEVAEEEPAEEVAPTIIPSYYDSFGNQIDIRYSRSIKANVIQADEAVKDFYSAIKNHILSYKGVKSRYSWKFDSFNKGREQLFKIKIRGKTICLYCALNPYEFDKTRYHHEAVDAKIFEAVPMLVKIKSALALKKAKELVDIEMAKLGIEKDPKFKEVDYVSEYPYEETEDLVQKKLIKVLAADVNMVKAAQPKEEEIDEPVEQIIEEPVVEVVEEPIEEVVEEAPVEEPVVEEVAEEEPAEEVAPTIIPSYYDSFGNQIDIRYSRSIKANVIQADEAVKDFYSAIKNHILSYKGVKSRYSWKFDSFNKGREQLFKIKIRGKTICLYCALNPYEFDKTRYHHEAVDAKIFEAVPMLVKIKSALALKKAKELVDIEMAKLGIEKDPKFKEVDYVSEYPYEETEDLVQKKLIKVLAADVNMVKAAQPKEEEIDEPVEEIDEPVVEPVEEPIEEVVEEVAEEIVEEEPVAEEVAQEVIEEPVAEEEAPVVEEVFQEEAPAEESTEDAVEETETIEEAAIEPVEEVIEEPAEEIVEEEPVVEEVHEPAKTVEEIQYVESISAEEVDELVVDEVVESLVEEEVEFISATDTKKAIVNIDVLAKEFNDGDVVDLASLKAKKLIDKKSKTVKILARGAIDKKLTVRAGEFSNTALKMIILTGGTAVHVTYKVK